MSEGRRLRVNLDAEADLQLLENALLPVRWYQGAHELQRRRLGRLLEGALKLHRVELGHYIPLSLEQSCEIFLEVRLPPFAIGIVFELHSVELFAPFSHFRDTIMNPAPEWYSGLIAAARPGEVDFIRHLPDVVGDEADELGLLSGPQLGIRYLLEGVLEALRVLDEEVIAGDHYLAILSRALAWGRSSFPALCVSHQVSVGHLGRLLRVTHELLPRATQTGGIRRLALPLVGVLEE